MCGGGGGNSSSGNSFGFSSGTSTYTPNPQAMAGYQQSIGLAQNAISRPYQPYQGEMTAGFTPDQMSAMQGVRNTVNIAQPYINAAKNLTGQAVDYSNPANFNQYSLNQYMNPYQQSVIDATMGQLAQTQAEAMQQAQSRSATRGTFGGSGQYLGQAEVARQQGLSNAQILAQLNAGNYQQAQNQYNQQQQLAIQTAQNAAYGLGQLGNMAQTSALTGINALLQSGGMQQQLAQQQLTGAYNQWLQALADPYQKAAFYSGILAGIGPNMGGTTTYSGINMGQQQQQQSGGGGGASGIGQMFGSLLMPFLSSSDEREKTDIKHYGKDENTGLDLYAYRYKGDPKSYPKVVGPMAQDVEEKYPGFVFDVGGRKAVADLGRFMPRDEKASGGSSSSDGVAATDPSAYYAPYGMSGPVQGSMQAAQSAQMDPGTAQFIKGAFDPRTAHEIARAKWVSPEIETRTAPEDSFGYFSQLTRALGSEEQAPRATRASGGGFRELPAKVNPNPLSGSPPIGVNFLDPKPSPGSLGDMISDTKLMFGANPIDSPQGFATIAAIPSAGMASSNLAQDAAKWAKGVVPPPAENIGKSKTADGIAKAKAEANAAVDAAKPGKGGGGGGGGGEGLGKLAKGAKSAIDKISGGKESALPAETTPETPQDTPASEAGKGFEGGVDTAPAVPETPPMADTGMGGMNTMADMSGGADWLKGLGGFGGLFAAHGGRIQKDIGGAAGGFDGPGASGDIAPSGLAEAGGIGAPSLLGTSGAGLGELTLGFGNKPSELAGFGDIKGETRTGNDLVKGWMDEYRADYKGGPQRTPKEQGMPDMPDAEYYKTPLNISEISIGSNGTPNPGGITSYTPIATGMKANGGIGLFPTFSPPTNGSDYNNTDKMFQAPKTNGKVQGYYTGLDSQQVNPDTGRFNIAYLAPYYGGFFNKGGRVSKAGGGSRGMKYGPPQPYDLTPEDLRAVAQTMHFEAGNQGDEGMLGVGHVARNRFESGRYGATPYDVVTAKNSKGVAQFTPWGTKGAGSNKNVANYNPTEHEMGLAQQALTESQDPTHNATHYYNPSKAHPKWGPGMSNPVQIGAHRFGTTAGGHGGGQPMMARLQDQGMQMAENVRPASSTPAASAGPLTQQWKPPAEIADKVNPTTPEPVVAQENFGAMTTPSAASSIQEAPASNDMPGIGGGNFDLGFNDEGPEINTPEIETAWDGGRIGMAAGGTRGSRLTVDQAVRLLMQNGANPTEAAYLAAIMMPESGGLVGNHSNPKLKKDNSFGLWQINMLGGMGPERMRQYGLKSYEDLYDPNVNARAAIDLVRNKRGLRNWSTYLHGDYKPYFNQARYYANKYADNPEAVKAPVEFTPARPSGFEPRAFAQASAPARRPMGIIPRIIQEVVGVPSAHAEPAAGSNLNRINRADPSGPLLASAAPMARGSAEGYMAHRAKVADRPTIFDANPEVAALSGEPILTPEGKWAQYPDYAAYLNGQSGFPDLGIGGTDVGRPMTYTGNRAPGFQDLTMNPFYQDEPVDAQDQPAKQQAQPKQAAAKQAQQEENPIEGFFNALGSGINELGTGIGQGLDQIGTGIGQGIEELGTGINSIFGEDNPQETTKKATKGATPNQSAQSDEAEGELDFGKLLGFKHGGKVKKSRKKMGR